MPQSPSQFLPLTSAKNMFGNLVSQKWNRDFNSNIGLKQILQGLKYFYCEAFCPWKCNSLIANNTCSIMRPHLFKKTFLHFSIFALKKEEEKWNFTSAVEQKGNMYSEQLGRNMRRRKADLMFHQENLLIALLGLEVHPHLLCIDKTIVIIEIIHYRSS